MSKQTFDFLGQISLMEDNPIQRVLEAGKNCEGSSPVVEISALKSPHLERNPLNLSAADIH